MEVLTIAGCRRHQSAYSYVSKRMFGWYNVAKENCEGGTDKWLAKAEEQGVMNIRDRCQEGRDTGGVLQEPRRKEEEEGHEGRDIERTEKEIAVILWPSKAHLENTTLLL